MKKSTAAGLLAAVMLIPVTTSSSTADEMKTYNVEQAVQKIKAQDYNSKITAGNSTELSTKTQQFQSNFADELEELQEKGNDYQDSQTKLQAEMRAYEELYNYWLLHESLKVKKQNVELAESEYNVTLSKRKRGVASEMDLLQAEMKVNNAKAEVEGMQDDLKSMQYKLNQGMKAPITEQMQVRVPEFSPLEQSQYDPRATASKVLKDHPALIPRNTAIATYDEIIDDAEDLKVPGENEYEKNIEQAEKAVAQTQTALEQAQASPTPDPVLIQQLTQKLAGAQAQLAMLEDQFNEAKSGRSKAEDELQDYYSEELAEARIQLLQLQDSLELLSYRYTAQFDSMSKELELYEKNIKNAQDLYEKTMKTYEQGVITLTDVEEVRLSVQQARLQLLSKQKEYAVLKEEFRLFKEGYLPGAGAAGQ